MKKAKVKLPRYANGALTPQEERYSNIAQSKSDNYNQILESQQRGEASYNTGKQALGAAGPYGAAISGIMNIGDAIGNPIRQSVEKTDTNGNLVNRGASSTGYIAGNLLNPYKGLTSTLNDPNASKGQKILAGLTGGISNVAYTRSYNDNLENTARAKIGAEQALQAEQDALNNLNTANVESPYFKSGGKMCYPNGGMLPNAEVESEENTLNPDGSTNQYNGPTHDEGGIPTQLDPGTLVFSDRLKLGKKTFAELNKTNNTNKEDKVLDDPKANRVKKLTAELMKMAKNKQSMKLFEEQEALKQSKLNSYAKRLGVNTDQFKYGGKKLPKYGPGDIVPSSNEDDEQLSNDFTNFLGQREYNNIRGNYDLYTPEDQALLRGEDPINSTITNNGIPQGSSNRSFNPDYVRAGVGVASVLSHNIGNIYDLQRSKTVDRERYNRVKPNYLDPSADIRYNNASFTKAIGDIKNASAGDANSFIANRKDLAINQMMTNSRIKQNYNNMNADIENRAKYYNAGTGDRETIANLQNQAQARNLKSSAYHNIGQSIAAGTSGSYRDYATEQRDKQYLKIIAAKYPEILQDPELAKLYK